MFIESKSGKKKKKENRTLRASLSQVLWQTNWGCIEMDRKEEVNRTEMQCLQKDEEHADQWH